MQYAQIKDNKVVFVGFMKPGSLYNETEEVQKEYGWHKIKQTITTPISFTLGYRTNEYTYTIEDDGVIITYLNHEYSLEEIKRNKIKLIVNSYNEELKKPYNTNLNILPYSKTIIKVDQEGNISTDSKEISTLLLDCNLNSVMSLENGFKVAKYKSENNDIKLFEIRDFNDVLVDVSLKEFEDALISLSIHFNELQQKKWELEKTINSFTEINDDLVNIGW
jgi:hypothetical protein